MATKITRDIVESYLNCKYKGHLRLTGASGTPSDYEAMIATTSASSREQALTRLAARYGEGATGHGAAVTAAVLKQGALLLLDASLEDDRFSLHLDALKRMDSASKLGDHYYLPVLHVHSDKVNRHQKLLLAVFGLALARVQVLRPAVGLVARGSEGRLTKVRLDAKLYKKAEQALDEVKRLQAEGQLPRLVLNDHCQMCEFRRRCREQAMKEDSLSLLRGLGEKEVRGYARKGILTLTQLAYTFRPRRRNRRTVQRTKRHHALQAMAIRDKRAYVFGTPELPTSPVTIYLDMEGLPDEGFVYLIGMIVVHDGTETRYSFWADSKEQEREMFERFLAETSRYGDFVVFSYGGYERTFLKRMKKTASRAEQVDRILEALANVLSVVYAHLYFPCHSNGLKDVAGCLGGSWSAADASGLQSIAWRKRWEAGHAEEWKGRLTTYNMDDCAALKKVVGFIRHIGDQDKQNDLESPDNEGCLPVGRAEVLPDQSGRPDWHNNSAALPAFQHIRKCGYFDYQREKVYFRTNETIRKACVRRVKGKAKKLPPNRTVEIRQEACPGCNSSNILRLNGSAKIKVGYDLRFSPSGIRRQVIHYTAAIHRCRECRKEFHPERYKRRDKHLHGLKSWAMYQHVGQRISLHNLQDMFDEFFGLRIVEEELLMIKSLMAKRYMPTWERIRDKILSGCVIHVDETPINLRNGKGYVWVLANMEEVIYLYQPTREGDFLHELLKTFSGVLVSDFFSAYDSIPCAQQRCLIHLVRDFNDDILKNPYDDELKSLGSEFGQLLRQIISTVDRYGLKKRHLNKHGDDVRRFFRTLASRQYRSECAGGYQARLIKNESKLFTFLEHDGVPWNNNNAECAVKRFACYRRISDGQILEAGLKDYLVLLSIFQTCKYKGVSFLKFLLSREEDVGAYCQRRQKKNDPPAVEIYPDGFSRRHPKTGRDEGAKDGEG
jgi:predicted RecB family nuclease